MNGCERDAFSSRAFAPELTRRGPGFPKRKFRVAHFLVETRGLAESG